METLGKHVYSYRIDMSHNAYNEKELIRYVSHSDVIAFIFAREIKPKDKIPHYQGIIWFNKKQDRTYWSNFSKKPFVRKSKGKGDGPLSFVMARNIGTLAKYCNDKEGHGIIKSDNIDRDLLDKIGKWKTKDVNKKTRKLLVEEFKNNFKLRYGGNEKPFICRDIYDCYGEKKAQYNLKVMMCETAYDTFIHTDFNPPIWRHIPNMLKHILHKKDYCLLVYNIEPNPEQKDEEYHCEAFD